MAKIHQTAHQQSTATARALPISKYAAAYGVHVTTVWRAVRDGRLEYVVVGKRKLILPPVVQREDPNNPPKRRSRRKN
jgi:hypothetical protein